MHKAEAARRHVYSEGIVIVHKKRVKRDVSDDRDTTGTL